MSEAAKSTQSVLDMMTAGVMSRKNPSLTPVGVEGVTAAELAAAPPAVPPIATLKGDVFPHDGGIGEQVVHSARAIRDNLEKIAQYTAQIEECLQSIEREAGLPPGGLSEAFVPKAERQRLEQAAKEAASDASFKASQAKQEAQAAVASDEEETFDAAFKRKQKEAQAAVFGSGGPAPAPKPAEPEEAPAWVCPEHKTSVTKTSPKGRIYLACPTCGNFQ